MLTEKITASDLLSVNEGGEAIVREAVESAQGAAAIHSRESQIGMIDDQTRSRKEQTVVGEQSKGDM